MKRLGKYSGKIYEESEVSTMEECGVCIPDEQAYNDQWLKSQHQMNLLDCMRCGGCPVFRYRNESM